MDRPQIMEIGTTDSYLCQTQLFRQQLQLTAITCAPPEAGAHVYFHAHVILCMCICVWMHMCACLCVAYGMCIGQSVYVCTVFAYETAHVFDILCACVHICACM